MVFCPSLKSQLKSSGKKQKGETLGPRSMYFMATSSLESLTLISLATPKFPEPMSLTSSYFSMFNLSSFKSRTWNNIRNPIRRFSQKSGWVRDKWIWKAKRRMVKLVNESLFCSAKNFQKKIWLMITLIDNHRLSSRWPFLILFDFLT